MTRALLLALFLTSCATTEERASMLAEVAIEREIGMRRDCPSLAEFMLVVAARRAFDDRYGVYLGSGVADRLRDVRADTDHLCGHEGYR